VEDVVVEEAVEPAVAELVDLAVSVAGAAASTSRACRSSSPLMTGSRLTT
jgi:hypothetical protein